MEINESSDKAHAGLELDKIDISDFIFPSKPTRKEKKSRNSRKSAVKPKRVRDVRVAMIIGGMILSLAVVYLLWDEAHIDFSVLKRMISRHPVNYTLTVGPVMTSFGGDDHVKMAVQIECKKTRQKMNITALERQMHSKIMLLLASPHIRPLMKQRDFNALKPFIQKEVEKLKKGIRVESIYFSEISFY